MTKNLQNLQVTGLVPEAEAARQHHEHPKTWARRRRLRQGPPFIRIGRQFYYRPEAIEAWHQSLEIDPAAEPKRRGRR